MCVNKKVIKIKNGAGGVSPQRNKKVIFSYGRNVCKIEKIEIKVSIEREGTIVNKIKSNLKENVIV
jgi:hypothetical protein